MHGPMACVADPDRRHILFRSCARRRRRTLGDRSNTPSPAHEVVKLTPDPSAPAVGSRRGFEPVSAETQPVSGRLRIQISDIEKSSSRDSPPESRPSAEGTRNSSPETRLLAANLRKCPLFAERRKSPERDRGGWLGNEDSNGQIPETSRRIGRFQPALPPHPKHNRSAGQ
jgi:hypothetical protein